MEELVRRWLSLPPGPWPPDHYALLGLPPGEADPASVECATLERMARVRDYQLQHPDAATEAMNLLARALDCLSCPRAKAEYDRLLAGVPDAPPAPSADETIEAAAETAETPASPGYEVVPDPAPAPPPPPAPPTEPPPLPPPAPVYTGWARRKGLGDLRAAFARLVRARRLHRAWEAAGAWLGEGTTPAGWSDADELARHLAAVLRHLPDGPPAFGDVGRPGQLVVALARQPLSLATLRGLLPSQRRALADDWSAGLTLLLDHLDDLRDALPRPPRPAWMRPARVALRTAAAWPELAWSAVGASALLLALLRAWAGR